MHVHTYQEESSLDGIAWSLNENINHLLLRISKDRWDENIITDQLIGLIRDKLNGIRLIDEPELLTLSVCTYKLKGKPEIKFGDLAVLVKLIFRDGRTLTGAATYEAKKREWATPRLSSIKKGQLKHIYHNTWHGKLLIYDHEQILIRTAIDRHWGGSDCITLTSTANVVHLSHPVELKITDTSLYRYADPFTFQLCCRNLRGIDLELEEAIINQISTGAGKLGAPTYVVAIAVSHGSIGNPDATEIEVNKDVYEPIPSSRDRRG